MDSRLRRFPPDRASAVPYGQAMDNAARCPALAHRSAAAHKLHSARFGQDKIRESQNHLSGSGFSLFLPGGCPSDRDHRKDNENAFDFDKDLTGKFWEKVKLDALPLHTTDVMRVQIVKRPTNKVKYLVIRVLSYNNVEIDAPLESPELSRFTISSGFVANLSIQRGLFDGIAQ